MAAQRGFLMVSVQIESIIYLEQTNGQDINKYFHERFAFTLFFLQHANHLIFANGNVQKQKYNFICQVTFLFAMISIELMRILH